MCFPTMSSGQNEKRGATFIPDETSSCDQESNTTRHEIYIGNGTFQSPHNSNEDNTVFSSTSNKGEDFDGTKFAVQRLGCLSLQDNVTTNNNTNNNTNNGTNNIRFLHMVSPASSPATKTITKTMSVIEAEALSCDPSSLKPRSTSSASPLSPSSSAPSLPNHPQDPSSFFRTPREQFLVFY